MKYILSIMAVLTLALGGVEVTHAEMAANQMQTYSVGAESANIPGPTVKPPTKKKKAKTTKPKITKTTKKIPPKSTKKNVHATTKKPKKTTKAKSKDAVSATATEMEPANLDDVNLDDKGDLQDVPAVNSDDLSAPGLDMSVKDDQTSDLPEASPPPSKKGAFKGLAVATSAAGSGLGLMFLIRKLFFH